MLVKELTNKQIKMQEAILLAVHKGCTLSEAKAKEHDLFCCYAIEERVDYDRFFTLPRVLIALGEFYIFESNSIKYIYDADLRYRDRIICTWDLLNSDGSDAILRDQSQNTQDAIYNILFATD